MECEVVSLTMLSRGGLSLPLSSISLSHHLHFNKFLQTNQIISSTLCTLNAVQRHPSMDFTMPISNSSTKLNGYLRNHPSFRASTSMSMPSSPIVLERATNREAVTVTVTVTDHVRPIKNCKDTLKRFSGLLRICASRGALRDGKAVHGQVMRSEVDPDAHLWVSLMNMYVKCGDLWRARRLLDEMPERDVVAWTVVIGGLVGEGNGGEGFELYCEMRRENVLPNSFTYATVLKGCTMCLEMGFGEQLHCEVIKTVCLTDVFVGSAIVDLYAKCGKVECAERVFFTMPEQNAVSWNVLLNGYAEIGDCEKVLGMFGDMADSEARLSEFTLSSVLKGCVSSGNVRYGRAIHAVVIKIGSEHDGFLSSNLLQMYSVCGMALEASKVFTRIKNADVVVWSAMISSLVQHEYKVEAAKLFNKMRRKGSKPNQFTLSSVISAATEMGDCEYGNSIHACVWKLGFDMDNTVGNSLVRMYTKNGFLEDGFRVVDAMTDQDSVSWNALLSGFHDGDACGEGPRVFNHMLTEGFKPNKYTFISTLRSCSSMSNLHCGQQLHGQIIKNDLAIDNFMETALVDMYAKCCCLEDALEVFNKMKERDTFTWTTIITGCAQNNHGETAISYFRQMQREGVCPNEFTLSSYLRACCAMAALENGRQLHSRVIKSGQSDDLIVMSALVDMYCKCGCLIDAEAVFNNLVSRDTVAWNTIICGYSQHGQGKKALDAFQGMLDEGVLPDRITFIGVLSACSHVGLVEEGRRYFDSLSNSYGITPTIEHYACMVDILGRAGKLGEVEKFIEKMPLIPDSLIWQTVLGACSKHGNMDLGEKAAEQLLELEPQMDSTYILLSNIYASKGRWKDVSMVRAKMSSQGVKKEPGCSWVEVDGQVHVFLPNDASHPMVPEIYQKLEELGQDLVSAGYIPNTDYVHHNVSHGEKVKSLLYHSEKLALAFAIISGGLQKPIRIFKNLRICGDCHNAIKLISNITNREIIIRDVSRFHHFQNGSCSCQDYW